MLFDRLVPLRARKSVDYGQRAEVDQLGRDRRLLSGNNYTHTQVSLLADNGKESLGKRLCSEGVGHILPADVNE